MLCVCVCVCVWCVLCHSGNLEQRHMNNVTTATEVWWPFLLHLYTQPTSIYCIFHDLVTVLLNSTHTSMKLLQVTHNMSHQHVLLSVLISVRRLRTSSNSFIKQLTILSSFIPPHVLLNLYDISHIENRYKLEILQNVQLLMCI